jgi:hypothetical protein
MNSPSKAAPAVTKIRDDALGAASQVHAVDVNPNPHEEVSLALELSMALKKTNAQIPAASAVGKRPQ